MPDGEVGQFLDDKRTAPELDRKTITRVIGYQFAATIAVSLWVIGYRRPPLLAVALHILLPWIAIAVAVFFPNSFTVSLYFTKERKSLSFAWLGSLILVPAIFRCVVFPNWVSAFWVGCIPGMALFFSTVILEKRWGLKDELPGMGILLLFCLVYGCGVVRELDPLLDHSPDRGRSSPYIEKVQAKGKRFVPRSLGRVAWSQQRSSSGRCFRRGQGRGRSLHRTEGGGSQSWLVHGPSLPTGRRLGIARYGGPLDLAVLGTLKLGVSIPRLLNAQFAPAALRSFLISVAATPPRVQRLNLMKAC